MGNYLFIYLFSLWDNLDDDLIIDLLNQHHKAGVIDMKNNFIAEKIAKFAEMNSIDINYESPFSKKAKENGIFHLTGGKQDDITVIISQIINEDGEIMKNHSSFAIGNIKMEGLI
jgi:Glu-tRNA(Gln) amidotransferase subunit E-like FAD-binding protein